MANPEHVTQLEKGVTEWNAWRAANPEVIPDLSGVTIYREFFQGIDLREANLRGVNLRFCLFTDADFSRADLRTAILRNSHAVNARFDGAQFRYIGPQINFSGSSFVGATFEECDLAEANFFMANLSEATFVGTNLMRAMLRRARLDKAHLTSCGLHEAFLVDTSLHEARVDQCVFSQTVVTGVDLSVLASLEDCQYDGPSHVAGSLEPTAIGLRQRPYRQGAVETFFRGAGIPDEYLLTFRGTIQRPIEFYSCFISYSHSDAEFARRIYNDLQMSGIRCWLDEHALLPGDDIYAEVDKGIRLWDKVLLCCSRSSLDSWWVERELDTAFEKEKTIRHDRGENKLVIIPLDLDGYLLDQWNGSHASALRKRLAARFLGWEADGVLYRRQLERLQAALRSDEAARAAPPQSKL